MIEHELTTRLQIYDSATELPIEAAILLQEAKKALVKSYSPYSGFQVGAAIRLVNGAIVSAANQENASYPMCVCAEVAVLNAAAAMYPGIAMSSLAITTRHIQQPTTQPAAPCGQCRQTILEYELRYGNTISITMAGEQGQVYEVASVKELLPLHFSASDLGIKK